MAAKNQSFPIKDVVFRLQLLLFEGIQNENQLFAAGSVISRSDYEDIVTERSIASLCGYPLCNHNLSSDNNRKGRYRISLKEHKVYDLEETYKFCSSNCLVNSRAFSGGLNDERCSILNPEKLRGIMGLFENLSLDSKENIRNNGDLGIKIQEKIGRNVGEVSIEEWMGPSNAIEGYVPRRNDSIELLHAKDGKKPEHGSKAKSRPLCDEKSLFGDLSFMSTVITDEEYSVSKISSEFKDMTFDTKLEAQTGKLHGKESNEQFTILETSSTPAARKNIEQKARGSKVERTKVSAVRKKNSMSDAPSTSNQQFTDCNFMPQKPKGESNDLSSTLIKPSLKQPGTKNLGRSVTWADEKIVDTVDRNLPVVIETEKTKECFGITGSLANADNDNEDMLRIASAEACAMALSQAAEAISSSGQNEISDAVSESGIIILPRPSAANEEASINRDDIPEPHSPLKRSNKPSILQADLFNPEDSWYDAPPEGFNLTLSSFATMWMALFAWITSSSLAYIYGKDESSHEQFLCIDGKEYPRKLVSADGRSSEIKQTLAGYLTRAVPGLVAELGISVPISNLEKGMGHLLDTMTFIDALPAFRMKQWQVIVLLFIEALSVGRIPSLSSYMINRSLLDKVLDRTQIKSDEYDIMKDHILPLGRVPPEFFAHNDD